MTWLHPEIRRRIRTGASVFEQRLWRRDLQRWDEEVKPDSIARNQRLQRTPVTELGDAAFAAHLEEISRAREPSTLADVSIPSRRPRVVVTLDDGYRDNLTNALPIAESKGIPITVFVTSGILGKHNGFWWDRLGTLLRSRPPHVRSSRTSSCPPPAARARRRTSSCAPHRVRRPR